MNIATSGAGDRSIFVSYISEVPVWKSPYRILLPTKADASPLLQGWAIVDNTVGEDWKDVELSLVAGAPQSFIQELSQPYYTRRPVIGLPQTAMLTPQTHEGTIEDFDRLQTFANLNLAPPPPPPQAMAGKTLGLGAGNAGGVAGGAAGGPVPMVKSGTNSLNFNSLRHLNSPNAPAEKAAADMETAAYGQDLGDLFQYNLKEKVTILKNHSALVPIINSPIKAEKVTLWTKGSLRPLRARSRGTPTTRRAARSESRRAGRVPPWS